LPVVKLAKPVAKIPAVRKLTAAISDGLKDLRKADGAAENVARFPEGPSQLNHIFREAPGHVADTPANRVLIQGVADDAAATLGTDKFGNVWAARTLGDGTQVWVQTRNGVIQNAGINQTPRAFNPEMGLSGQ